jgi:hypothetical protein
MFSLAEMKGQSSLHHKGGSIEFNTDCYRHKRPAWLVVLKLLGVLAMIAVGTAIALPTLLEFEYPLWQAIAITAGSMLVYIGIAFFIRPEANTDNIGDGVNRILWRAHCVLGPGRFTAETLLDLCVLLGVVSNEDVIEDAPSHSPHPNCADTAPATAFDATRPIAPLDPNRFAQSSGNFVAGQIQLDSQKYFSGSAQTPAAH